MFNILLDELPTEWNGCKIDTDFQIGIQISQCMSDGSLSNAEKLFVAVSLLFGDDYAGDYADACEAINWFLNGWNQDNISSGKGKGEKRKREEIMDFDTDQWRIYAAFKMQYGIDLNTEKMHFWVYMGLLSSLEECAFTRIISIREKEITSKMPKEERDYLSKAKAMFRIKKEEVLESDAEKEERLAAIEEFNRIRKK